MLRLTFRILFLVGALGLPGVAQAARPMAEYYARLGLAAGAAPDRVDEAFVSKLEQQGFTGLPTEVIAHVIAGALEPDGLQTPLDSLAEVFGPSVLTSERSRRAYLDIVEAFVMIRAVESSAETGTHLDTDDLERGFAALKSQGNSETRREQLQAGRRSLFNQGVALLLSFGISKLLLEHLFFLANATGSRTLLAASLVTTFLYVVLPRLYVNHPEVNFRVFGGWIAGAYRRALISSLGSTLVIGGCVKILH